MAAKATGTAVKAGAKVGASTLVMSTDGKWKKDGGHFSTTAAGSPESSLLESNGGHKYWETIALYAIKRRSNQNQKVQH